MLVPKKFPSFDGLRAIAALLVLLFHTGRFSGFDNHARLGVLTVQFNIGVTIFFVISGFLIYRPFVISHLAGRPSPVTRRFYERRLLRIVPAYWCALTVLWALGLVHLGDTWKKVAAVYLFAQIYSPSTVKLGLHQAWSLCYEMAFYLALPVVAWVIARGRGTPRQRLRWQLGGVLSLFFGGLAFDWWVDTLPFLHVVHGHFAPGSEVPLWLTAQLPLRLSLFAAGMVLAVLSSWWTEHGQVPAVLAARWFPWMAWLVAFGSIGLLCVVTPATTLITFISAPRAMAAELIMVLGSAALLLPAIFGPDHKDGIRRFLEWRPMVAIGLVSYGIYLWHYAIAVWLSTQLTAHHRADSFVVLSLLTFVVTGVVATLSYVLIERPGMRMRQRLTWWRQRRVVPGDLRAE